MEMKLNGFSFSPQWQVPCSYCPAAVQLRAGFHPVDADQQETTSHRPDVSEAECGKATRPESVVQVASEAQEVQAVGLAMRVDRGSECGCHFASQGRAEDIPVLPGMEGIELSETAHHRAGGILGPAWTSATADRRANGGPASIAGKRR